jgi:3D (Asp-Asp-Asp) domain-containing protein
MTILRLLLISLSAVFLCSCATAPTGRTASSKRLTVRTTAYTAAEPGGAHAACGTRLHFGGNTYSAAADWSWLPLGTRFRMKETGRTYVIEDYGSALVGKQTIDLFMPSGAAMRQWGTRTVNIDILEWGSRAMSLKMLEPRQKAGFVRSMVVSLRKPAPRSLLALD